MWQKNILLLFNLKNSAMFTRWRVIFTKFSSILRDRPSYPGRPTAHFKFTFNCQKEHVVTP